MSSQALGLLGWGTWFCDARTQLPPRAHLSGKLCGCQGQGDQAALASLPILLHAPPSLRPGTWGGRVAVGEVMGSEMTSGLLSEGSLGHTVPQWPRGSRSPGCHVASAGLGPGSAVPTQ